MDLDQLKNRLATAKTLAKHAGQIILDALGKTKTIELKESFADLVTETDKAVEAFLCNELKKAYPNDQFIGEESGRASWTDQPTWIIDPVDGTTNFVHTFPYSCISIGFTVNKERHLAVVYNPNLNLLYTAIKGQGAKLVKGHQGETELDLRVRPCESLSQALILCEFGSARDENRKEALFKNLEAISWQCHGTRMMGSAAMNICAVASGHADAYYEFGLHIWDMAAAALILTEAGGFVSDTRGGPLDMCKRNILAACSESLAKEIGAALKVHLELEPDC